MIRQNETFVKFILTGYKVAGCPISDALFASDVGNRKSPQ